MRKRPPERSSHDRWLVSYADFITLLFAFFVVMYAVSRADLEKMKAFSESVRRAFGGDLKGVPMGMNSRAVENAELKKLGELMRESLSRELGKAYDPGNLEIFTDGRGLVLRLSARGFYDKGSAEVRADALPALDRMAKMIKATNRFVRVEGHTDDTKATSELYPSNWELSTARAAWLVRYLIQQWQLDPRKLEASGYAEFRPIAPNTDAAGRERNRRVEILVLRREAP